MLADLHLFANISEHLYYEEGVRSNDYQIMSKVPSEKVVVQSFIKQIVVQNQFRPHSSHLQDQMSCGNPMTSKMLD